MDDLIGRMRAEEIALQRKLEAVRAFIHAYTGDEPIAPKAVIAKVVEAPPVAKRGGVRTSEYSEQILAAAKRMIEDSIDPVPTRDLVAAMDSVGIEIRGQDKSNALSALLSRNAQFKSNGRTGWTLTVPNEAQASNENEAPNGYAEGASEAGEVAASPDDTSADDLL